MPFAASLKYRGATLQGRFLDSLPWNRVEGDRYPDGMTDREPSGTGDGGGKEGFSGRAAIGYDHGYDGEVFYLGLALDPNYIDGFVEGCLERIGEGYSEDEAMFRDLWEDESQRELVIESLKADCQIRPGRPPMY